MYYPKSKVTENLHTNSGEFVDAKTGKSYQGSYHSTYDGNYYTGATHTPDSQQLLKAGTPSSAPSNTPSSGGLIQPPMIANFEYDQIVSNRFAFLKQRATAVAFYPVPTEQDYAIGQLVRYFMKRVNGSPRDIREISKDGFDLVKSNTLYLSVSLPWKLSGPLHDQVLDLHNTIYGVWDTNARTVASTESSFPGITSYLSNLQEFARISLVI